MKYSFSRKWYEADYDDTNYTEVVNWCIKHFGPHPRRPDAWSRWVHTYESRIQFRDEKDFQWFVLRWGS